jgi:hypothetical protein
MLKTAYKNSLDELAVHCNLMVYCCYTFTLPFVMVCSSRLGLLSSRFIGALVSRKLMAIRDQIGLMLA